jgi:hypothetical protein
MLRFGVDGNQVDNISSGGQYLFFSKNGESLNEIFYPETGISSEAKHE